MPSNPTESNHGGLFKKIKKNGNKEVIATPILNVWDKKFPPGFNVTRKEDGRYYVQNQNAWDLVSGDVWVIGEENNKTSQCTNEQFDVDYEDLQGGGNGQGLGVVRK